MRWIANRSKFGNGQNCYTTNALVVVRTYGNLIVVDAAPSTNYTKVLRVTTSQLPTALVSYYLLVVPESTTSATKNKGYTVHNTRRTMAIADYQ